MSKKHYSILLFASIFISRSAFAHSKDSSTVENPPIATSATVHATQYQDNISAAYKFQIQAGIFMPFSNTQMQIGNDKGNLGTDIDLENDLGFNTQSFAAFGAFEWRISRRSRLNLSYFYLGRSSSYTLEKEIHFRDEVYPVSANIKASSNTHIGRLTYSYAIFSKPQYEAGLLIGSHVVDAKMIIALNASVGSVEYEDNFKLTAPLPDIGVFGSVHITDKLSFLADVSYLPVKVSNVKINILTYNAMFKYQAYRNLGLSLSYTGLNFNINIDGDPLNGYLKWGYQGPSLTATYSFGSTRVL